MESLVGHAVTVCLAEETPPFRLEGRIEDDRDGLLEVRLVCRELTSLKKILVRTLRIDLEYARAREVWGMTCRLERYGLAFPPVVLLRPAGTPRLVHRRRHPRYATNLPVRLSGQPTGEANNQGLAGTWHEGRLVNLSRGGAAVALPPALSESDLRLLSPGQETSLQFVAARIVRPRGRIVRRELNAETMILGLEFVSLTSHDTLSLDAYLAKLETTATK
jgi:hypothetical protein